MDQKSSQPHEMEGEVYFPAPEIVRPLSAFDRRPRDVLGRAC